MRVEKIGRIPAYLRIIRDISFDYSCPYSFGAVVMEDQILIEGLDGDFGASGDSGALVVDSSSSRATGLLFAVTTPETTTFGVANHMRHVLSALSVRLVV